ncbi:hypothetical protein GCM10023261_15300 [Bartonella jaculi]|uniref:Uncharacterized protein n=1 Tax=Bartonella jaculi TaxID=686226 RepID=A0ABP9N792_9HYPH
MNIRYCFSICVIVLVFSSVVKASERAPFQGVTSVIIAPTVSTTSLPLNKKVDSLLNKVILPTHMGDHSLFWRQIAPLFQKARRVYVNLGRYIYASIFSIFNW